MYMGANCTDIFNLFIYGNRLYCELNQWGHWFRDLAIPYPCGAKVPNIHRQYKIVVGLPGQLVGLCRRYNRLRCNRKPTGHLWI